MGILDVLRGEEPGPLKKLLNYHDKGQFGEYLLEYAVTSRSIPGEMYTFRNLYIPYQGKYAEMDLVMLHEQGLFVFENKNYNGWIFGDEKSLKWTQRFQNGEKYQFYNPIRQNCNHIKALASLLQLSEDMFRSCIVFSDECSLRSVPLMTEKYVVLQKRDVVKWLKSAIAQSDVHFSQTQLINWAAQLNEVCDCQDAAIKSEHVEQRTTQFKGNVCPFCGSPLVLRNGRFGAFWGCSSYPACKYTRKYDLQ